MEWARDGMVAARFACAGEAAAAGAGGRASKELVSVYS